MPGEEATLRPFRNRKEIRYEVEQILKPSTDRVKAPCPYYERCGGCHIQHMSLESQNQFKKTQVVKLMKGIAKVDPITAMESPYAYRNKSHISYGLDS
ncbi:(Uracil-5)-methyltransferase family like protein, partial [Aduncisulcus paluster]